MSSMTAGAVSVEITAYDNMSSAFFGAPSSHGTFSEVNEVEHNCIATSAWDLRSFMFDPTTKQLQIKGGYNMWSGNEGLFSGDIFIDVNGDRKYGNQTGNGVTPVPPDMTGNGYDTRDNSSFLWDYAVVFNRAPGSGQNGGTLTGGYTVYSLSGATDLEVYYQQNNGSNPFRVASGALGLTPAVTGTVVQTGGVSDYTLSGLDMSWLAGRANGDITFHFTMACGNDLLVGKTTSYQVPDAGLTLALLGGSLSALAFVSRRVRKNQ